MVQRGGIVNTLDKGCWSWSWQEKRKATEKINGHSEGGHGAGMETDDLHRQTLKGAAERRRRRRGGR